MPRRFWCLARLALLAALPSGASAAAPPGVPVAPPGLSAEVARLYRLVKQPHPGELAWQRIPWLTDLGEGIRLAKAEGRPLVLFVSGDDPLEKC